MESPEKEPVRMCCKRFKGTFRPTVPKVAEPIDFKAAAKLAQEQTGEMHLAISPRAQKMWDEIEAEQAARDAKSRP